MNGSIYLVGLIVEAVAWLAAAAGNIKQNTTNKGFFQGRRVK
jgi:hypothetical protein